MKGGEETYKGLTYEQPEYEYKPKANEITPKTIGPEIYDVDYIKKVGGRTPRSRIIGGVAGPTLYYFTFDEFDRPLYNIAGDGYIINEA